MCVRLYLMSMKGVDDYVPHLTQTGRGGKSTARRARKMSLPDAMMCVGCVLLVEWLR